MYIVAGHKGQAQAVRKKERQGRRRRLKGSRGRGTLEKEKPPVLGMLQRNGEVVIKMLANVKQKTIEPFIKSFISRGSLIYTDEYRIYLCPEWGMTAWSSGDTSTKPSTTLPGSMPAMKMAMGSMRCMSIAIEGFWSLLRSWLRPHRGISQEKLPLYLGFFEFVHNLRSRGRALLPSLIEALVAP